MKRVIVVLFFVLSMIPVWSDTINIQIVYDNSGSMAEHVSGSRKSEIAKRALSKIAVMISKFKATNKDTEINIGIVTFRGVAMKMSPFKPSEMATAISSLPPSGGGTPLGEAIQSAYGGLPKNGKSHIFVLTDGQANGSVDMADVISANKDNANVYFVAFDVNASVFNGVKKFGALVVEADNEKSLNNQVMTIFSQNILLEKEE